MGIWQHDPLCWNSQYTVYTGLGVGIPCMACERISYIREKLTEVFSPSSVKEPSRPSWDDYYLGIAKAVSARGDCSRRQHGAVIVKNHSIVSTGYNGTPPGSSNSCFETKNCPRALDPSAKHSQGTYDECWAVHAEANAIVRASWEELQDSTIYITGHPCHGCLKLIQAAGISRMISP